MENRKKISSLTPSKKATKSNSSQVHVVSSGFKPKKSISGCGCGKKRIK